MKIINIKVRTNKPETKIIGIVDGVYRVDVKAKPEKGEANKEIIRFFSKRFKKRVKIVNGLKSKEKLLAFEA